MRWMQMTCPTCGEPSAFLSERVAVQAKLIASLTEPGTFDYDGDSRTCWDTQEPMSDAEGNHHLWCAQGHDWWTQPTDPQSTEGSDQSGLPAPQPTPMLISWQWAENGTGMFIERVRMTPSQRDNLDRRLTLLEAQGKICDIYLGPEQAIPTPYEEFRARYDFLDEAFLGRSSASAA